MEAMSEHDGLTRVIVWLESIGSVIGWLLGVVKAAWNWLPSEWRAPTVIITVGGGLFSACRVWRDRRRLDITLVPNQYAVGIAQEAHYFLFNVIIVNPSSRVNSLREVQCSIGTEHPPFVTDPPTLLDQPVKGGTKVEGWINLPPGRVAGMGGYERLRFVFVPVHGRRRAFEFSKDDLLTEF